MLNGMDILSLDDLFDKVFIINLARREDRKSIMLKVLKNLKIENFEFFNAIDGATIDTEELYKQGILLDKDLGRGEIGCFLSHREVWKIAASRHYERILIMEDDIRFNPKYPSISRVMQHVPPNWDIVHFHSNVERPGRIKINDFVYRGDHEYGGCTCYALSNVGYIKLICKSAVIPYAVDGITALLSSVQGHKAYASENVCYVDVAAGSDISALGRKY